MNYNVSKTFLDEANIPNIPDELLPQVQSFQEMMMMYNCAIREVKTKLEVLNDDLSIHTQRNPIEFIKSRIKKPMSILEKAGRKGFDLTLESIFDNMYDIAGVRVICPFIDDIYAIADMLIKQDDITLLLKKDYIKTPKENGYRSLHLVIEVPVFFTDRKLPMKVEVQIRTIAMDFWATLEHELKYKKDIPNSDAIEAELKECADLIHMTDKTMLDIMKRLEESPATNVKEKDLDISYFLQQLASNEE